MDAVEFLKEKDRMHEMMKGNCEKCGLSYANNGMRANCIGLFNECPEKAVEIVEQWAREHPRKTRQSEFLKMFPDALLFDGVLDIDPCKIIHSKINSKECHAFDELGDVGCFECRKQFWNEEIE
mgnify:CR=1 FL=1